MRPDSERPTVDPSRLRGEGADADSSTFNIKDEIAADLDARGVTGRLSGERPDKEQFTKTTAEHVKFRGNEEARGNFLAFVNAMPEGEDKTAALEAARAVIGLDEEGNLVDPAAAGTSGEAPEDGQVTGKQFEVFMQVVGRYDEKHREVMEWTKTLDQKNLENIARRSGRFSAYAHTIGMNVLVEEWKNRMPTLAFRDPTKFDDLKRAYAAYDREEKAYTEIVSRRAGKLGITEDQYRYFMSLSKGERENSFREAVTSKYTGWSGMWERWGSRWRNKKKGEQYDISVNDLVNKGRQELEKMLKDTREQIDIIAKVLGDVGETPYARAAFIQAFRG